MVRRVCRVFGNAKDIVVLNDEAHHCYTPAPAEEAAEGGLDADERTEARQNAEEARVWFDGLQRRPRQDRHPRDLRRLGDAVLPQGLRATPEGTLFPWVVSRLRPDGRHRVRDRQDPARARVATTRWSATGPTYRDLWVRVRDALPRKGLRDTTVGEGDPMLPKELEGALASLYADYERSYGEWAGAGMGRPPVFIVVCSNTTRQQARLRLDRRLRPRRSPAARTRRRARQARRCSATSRAAAGATAR